VRAIVVGTGRMGTLVRAELARRGHEVLDSIGAARNPGGAGLTPERLRGADVALEFTTADAAPGNIERLLHAGVAVVSGTTGCDAELPRLRALAASGEGALLHAANFSIGLQAMLRAARELARALAAHPSFEPHLLDVHHRAKRDAPSGTALALLRVLEGAAGRAVPVTSVRTGHVPGTHALTFDGPHESLRLAHEVRDRAVFAEGAVVAAEWLVGRRGAFGIDDVLAGEAT
jgi:4-hydroxy-tetrahydrodipicolinate reductase